MSSEKEVVFPNELLEEMQVETTIFSPENEIIAIAALSKIENSAHILSLWQLLKDQNSYHPVQELAAFSFLDRVDLEDFLHRLPDMSGIEMLLILNPLPSNPIQN